MSEIDIEFRDDIPRYVYYGASEAKIRASLARLDKTDLINLVLEGVRFDA